MGISISILQTSVPEQQYCIFACLWRFKSHLIRYGVYVSYKCFIWGLCDFLIRFSSRDISKNAWYCLRWCSIVVTEIFYIQCEALLFKMLCDILEHGHNIVCHHVTSILRRDWLKLVGGVIDNWNIVECVLMCWIQYDVKKPIHSTV